MSKGMDTMVFEQKNDLINFNVDNIKLGRIEVNLIIVKIHGIILFIENK